MKAAGISYRDVACISVCRGPGLIGSLLVGCSFAKALCYAKEIPLVAVNHLEGHVFSSLLEERRPGFPFVALIVSGGHTCLYRVEGFGRYFELGKTRDDAAGEAYDKVSKLLGLGYPGGPIIDDLAKDGNPEAINFPRAYLPESLDFSFSGLKTAVLHFFKSEIGTSENSFPLGGQGDIPGLLNDIAASFQAAVVDVLVRKTEWAVRKEGVSRLALSGGVAANSELRRRMQEMADGEEIELFVAPPSLCTDNAAMIAAAGYHHFRAGNLAGLDLNPVAYLPL
jgi:N6-L-threonylcarbamoyladenine synthase